MRRIVGVRRPSLTDEDTIGRVVEFEDGSGLIQSFVPGKGWVPGGTSLQSLFTAGGVDKEYLGELGYSKEDVKMILADPTGTVVEEPVNETEE